MNITDVFGSQPLFKLGDHVYFKFMVEQLDDEVVYCKTYSMITGINFCSEYTGYVGWNYEVQVYKEITYSLQERKIELYPNLMYSNVNEIDLFLSDRKLSHLKIINSLIAKQLEQINRNSVDTSLRYISRDNGA